ncbi:unnamed protein product [Sphagnum compactum]
MSSSSSEAESGDSGDFESDEIEMYETEATYKIDSGILVAKNSDGTYRCPFSPNRKKQSFRHQNTKEKLHDLRGRLGLLTEHLRKFSDLKTVADVVEDKDRINDQLVQNLVAAVGRRNDRLEACHERFVVLQNIVSEVDNLRVKAEEEKRKMEEKHKQDLEELHQKAAMDTEQHRNRMLQHQVILANKMRALEERCAEMEQTETLMKQKNEAEVRQFEKAKEEAKKQLEEVSKQAELHAAMRYNQGLLQMKMIEKHEVQNKELEMQVQQQKTKLAVSQNRELEFQRVSEMLEIERGKIDGGGGQDEANNIESHEKTIKDLELKLADLQASYDLSDSMVSDLTRKEQASNDEIEEARKVAVMVLKDYGAKDKLANKMMGEIDKEPWEPACRLRYRLHEEGWDIKMATQISKWEALLKDHSLRPLKMVEVTPNELK